MTWNPIFPWWLVLIIALAVIGFVIWQLIAAPKGARRRGWAIRLVVVVLVMLACFRPGIGSQRAAVVERALDVFFVVDTSASIIAEDWDGTKPRLDGVKVDVKALAEAHPGARFSLITFDSNVVQRLPLTTDTSALESSLDALRPEMTKYSSGSSVGAAAELLAKTLKKASEDSTPRARVVYYFGDGEQTSTKEPESFKESAQYVSGGAVFGYGTPEGGQMRETASSLATSTPGYIEYQGQPAKSVIDENNLNQIAQQLGVSYQHRDAGTTAQAAQVNAEETDTSRSNDVERAFELYWILLIAATLLLLIELWRTSRAAAELAAAREGVERDEP